MAWLEGEGWHLLCDNEHPRAKYIKIDESRGKAFLAPARKQANGDYFVDKEQAEEAQIIEKRKDFLCHCYIIKTKDGKRWQVYWDSTDLYYNIVNIESEDACNECPIIKRW